MWRMTRETHVYSLKHSFCYIPLLYNFHFLTVTVQLLTIKKKELELGITYYCLPL